MTDRHRLLIINLGSTSSKFAFAENGRVLFDEEYDHSKEIKKLPRSETLPFRKGFVRRFLEEHGLSEKDVDAIAVRGMGGEGKYRHGAYLLTTEIADECRAGKVGHPGLSAGTIIGDELSCSWGVPAYLYDVVPTDEIYEVARITGIKGYRRFCHSHTLNGRATAKKAAQQLGLDFDKATFILCHMGGGTGTMCIKNGEIVDAYSSEEGAFSPIRAGRVPANVFTELYARGEIDKARVDSVLKKDVGLYGHLGTGDCIEVEKMIAAGDKKAEMAYKAMAYQLSKDIGALAAAAADGKVDAIVLTGGIAHSELMTGWIKKKTSFIAPVIVLPGSMEMEALAEGVTRVLEGKEQVNDYEETKIKHELFEEDERYD